MLRRGSHCWAHCTIHKQHYSRSEEEGPENFIAMCCHDRFSTLGNFLLALLRHVWCDCFIECNELVGVSVHVTVPIADLRK